MPDLTPDELAALAHWATHGRPGTPPVEQYIPDADELARVQLMVAPATAAWADRFDLAQTAALLRGFPRGEMEDKWIVFADDPAPSGSTAVHFVRSWTGAEIIRIDLQLTDKGSHTTLASWETDAERIKNPTEEFARTTFVEACRWVLRFEVAG